jgi:hypothetical protein
MSFAEVPFYYQKNGHGTIPYKSERVAVPKNYHHPGWLFLICRLIETESVGFETNPPISSKNGLLPFSPR